MRKKTVLVIDDDIVKATIIAEITESYGIEILAAYCGEKGLEIAELEKPDLILLDWQMPKMDGIETLRRLKKNPVTADIPVLMMTGVMTATDHLLEAYRAGVIDFLRKPIEKAELIARINSILMFTEFYNKKIEEKNKELVSQAIKLVKTNELTSEIITDIENLKTQYGALNTDLQRLLNVLISKINSNLKDVSWKQFEDYFKNVNPDFYTVLLKKHPDLTPSEIKLSTLLRLNLSTKDIATTLYQSADSIRVSRSRLRKKLNLESDDNLTAYLMGL